MNNGVVMPALGFGVFQTPPEETRATVECALATGYRHIDTAAAYGNERQVGEAAQFGRGAFGRLAGDRALAAERGTLTQAWSPIGGITFYRDSGHGSTLDDPVIGQIGQSHGKTPAQVMLRWHLQRGRSAIPKSTRPQRIAENIDVFDVKLTDDELAAIDGLDTGRRGGPEPSDITLAGFGQPIPED